MLIAGLCSVLTLTACNDIRSPGFIPKLKELRVCESLGESCPSADACAARPASLPSILPAGRTLQMCALGRYGGLNSPDDNILTPDVWRNLTSQVTWSTTAAAAGRLSVDASGLVTGIARSSALPVTATIAGLSPVTTNVRVTEPVLERVQIVPQGDQGRVLAGTSRRHQCFGFYSADPACTGPFPQSCDITNLASWTSSNAAVHSINDTDDKGFGRALSAGSAEIDCALEGITSDPGALYQVCDQSSITDVAVDPATVPATAIPVGATVQLTLQVTYTDCLTNQLVTITLTDDAEWTSDRPDVATVEDGLVTAVDAGSAQITGSFGGIDADPVLINVVDPSEQFRLEIGGPAVLISGINLTAEYTGSAIFTDPDTGEELDPVDVTATMDTVWSSSAPTEISFPDMRDGSATVSETAVPQTVTITLIYRGVSETFETQIASSTLTGVEVTPDFACTSASGEEIAADQGGPNFSSYPFELVAHAILEPIDAEGNPIVDADGNPISCSADATESSTWGATIGPVPVLDILGVPMLGECEGAPGTVGDDFENSPLLVSDAPGSKGEVTLNAGSFGTLGGSSCVTATLETFNATSTFYVLTDLIGPVCAFNATTAPSVAPCSELLGPPAAAR